MSSNRYQTKADSYVRRIRNDAKRAYAENYLAFLRGRVPNEPDSSAYPLSYMGAQAVRMRLDSLKEAGHDPVDRALDGENVWDIGQLSPGTKQELDRLVRFGFLVKLREPCGRVRYKLSQPNKLSKAS